MGNGWGKVWLRLAAMALVVIVIGLVAQDHKRSMDERAKHKVLLVADIRFSGWVEDQFLGKQYKVFYPGTVGRLALDCRSFRDMYKALGHDPLAEPVNSGCSLLFKDEPDRVIKSVLITPVKAVLYFSGNVQKIDVERMTETLLDMASMEGVHAKGVASIEQSTSFDPERWEVQFKFSN